MTTKTQRVLIALMISRCIELQSVKRMIDKRWDFWVSGVAGVNFKQVNARQLPSTSHEQTPLKYQIS